MDLLTQILAMIDWRAALVIALVFLPLEHFLPLHDGQKTFRKGWGNDLFYMLVNALPIKLAIFAVLTATMTAANHWVPGELTGWVQGLPLWVQVPAVIFLADLGFYAAHRTFHAVPFLWRFHAIHHSIEEMDWLAAHRVHPVDQIVTMACSLVPVYALGFDTAAIAIHALIYQWHSLLLHSNVKLGFGPLGRILASPHFHHWHHANEREAYDKNFAGQLSLIDWLFGTHHSPKRLPAAYGCEDPVPDLYHQQLAYPLIPAQMSKDNGGVAPLEGSLSGARQGS